MRLEGESKYITTERTRMTKFSLSHNRITKILIAAKYIKFCFYTSRREDVSLLQYLCHVARLRAIHPIPIGGQYYFVLVLYFSF